MNTANNNIVKALESIVGEVISGDDINNNFSRPKNESFGDISFPCHILSKHYKKSPKQISDELKEKIFLDNKIISNVESVNGFLNFKYNDSFMANEILNNIINEKENYGTSQKGEGKTIVIDYSAPNLGKPLHVGHIRSTITGDALKRILTFTGYKVHGINYLGDVGLHIGKLISAYNKWGNDERLNSEPEHEMFELYTKFQRESKKDNSLEKDARKIVKEIESGNKEYNILWDKIRDWSLDAFDRSYELLDVSFEETTGQSYFSERGKEIVDQGKNLGIILTGKEYKKISNIPKKELDCINLDDSSVVANLDNHKLHPKSVIRSDGSAIYCTQDLGAAVTRFEEHNFDKMLYVVANEQGSYFKQVFAILNNLGYEWSDRCEHVGFGFINLEEGRMSTREGNVVFLEDVLGKAVDKAYDMIKSKDIEENLKQDVAKKVGIGSLKYSVLSVELDNEIKFSWDKTLSLNGKTGAYIQYSYVRANSILNSSNIYNENNDVIENFNSDEFKTDKEKSLIKILGEFPDKVNLASENLKPNLIGAYMYDVAKKFNEFYSEVKIVGTKEEKSRLALVYAAKTVIKNSGELLGIQMPEVM